MNNTILVTGGAGFIGSHTCKNLSTNGYQPVVFDNLSTGHRDAVIYGPLVNADVRDATSLDIAIRQYRPTAIIHFAASAYVGESMTDPGTYYDNNVIGILSVVKSMVRNNIAKIVFSSSCATYGIPDYLPIDEKSVQKPINPYGMTKLIGESILKDFSHAHGIKFVALRYFNACGADSEGVLRERHDPETHLIPRALMAATGLLPCLEIFGDDYDTQDGTCIRDYIHVEDLAEGHTLALRYLERGGESDCFNLGTGNGLSIREILRAIESTGRHVPTSFQARRLGDPASLYANSNLARQKIGFEATRSDIKTIIETAVPQFEAVAKALRTKERQTS